MAPFGRRRNDGVELRPVRLLAISSPRRNLGRLISPDGSLLDQPSSLYRGRPTTNM